MGSDVCSCSWLLKTLRSPDIGLLLGGDISLSDLLNLAGSNHGFGVLGSGFNWVSVVVWHLGWVDLDGGNGGNEANEFEHFNLKIDY